MSGRGPSQRVGTNRAVSPVVGTVVLVALTVVLASVVGTAFGAFQTDSPAPRVDLSASADASTDRITITHRGGDTLHVERLTVEISIDGQPLATQPPVPFFAAEGFQSGPSGPFNSATTGPWTAGETAGLRLASTNDPHLQQGATVTVELYHEEMRLVRLQTVA